MAVEYRLAAFAEVQTAMAKGGLESSTSHWANQGLSTRKATAGPDRPDHPKRVPVFTSNGVIHMIDAVLLLK